MSLLNVRLGPEEERMAAALRSAGVAISGVVREALRAEYERRIGGERRLKGSEVVGAILESLPDPPGLPPREFSLADRHAVRSHVRATLSGRSKPTRRSKPRRAK
jgi:hypothetical protein